MSYLLFFLPVEEASAIPNAQRRRPGRHPFLPKVSKYVCVGSVQDQICDRKSQYGPGGGRGTCKSIKLTLTYGSMMFLYHLITLAENIGKAVLATAARNNLAYLEQLTPSLFPVCHERTMHPFLQLIFGTCLHRHNMNPHCFRGTVLRQKLSEQHKF